MNTPQQQLEEGVALLHATTGYEPKADQQGGQTLSSPPPNLSADQQLDWYLAQHAAMQNAATAAQAAPPGTSSSGSANVTL